MFNESIGYTKGFSLVEILVVITIIGILASVIFSNFGGSQAQARDTDRQSNLRKLEIAIENFRRDNRVYPEGCNAGDWSGHNGAFYCSCSGPGEIQSDAYICGLVPMYIDELPIDDHASGDSGYVYYVNNDRSAYKLVAHESIETGIGTMSACPDSCDSDDCDSPPSNSIAVWGGVEEDVICNLPD